MAETSDRRPIGWGGVPTWPAVRALAGLVAAAAVATLGALVLGEHPFSGWLPPVAGVLVGLVVAEVALTAGGAGGPAVAVVVGGLAGGSLVWAGWISAGEGLRPVPGAAWLAGALAAAVGAARCWRHRR